MTTEPATPPEQPSRPQQRGQRTPNAFDRFFPGPAPEDPRYASRLDAIRRAAERRAEMQAQRAQSRHGGRDTQPALAGSPQHTATDDELEQLRTALQEQTDVMRALLDANVAIRDDARSTAQNSRTFAVAGIVIAFFTLAATVVTVVIAVALR